MSMTELAPLLSKATNLTESGDVMFPTLTRSNMPPTYLQRAKTFTASHRPTVRKRDPVSDMLLKSAGSLQGQWQPDFPPASQRKNRHNNPTVRKRDPVSDMLLKSAGSMQGQWQPDFPPASQRKNRHNKFVPMQMRTQPMNLPGGKQTGASGEKGNWAPLEVGILRSKTTLSPSTGDSHLDIGDTGTEFSLTPHRQFTRRGSGQGSLKPVKEGKLNLHTLNTSRGTNEAMSADFGMELVEPSGGNSKLQSAR
ncbi:hypothetical protein NP493_189g01009 [Ridgeia piscesae]|uniref:Uncharacterized protein n=1 Tax=Ridgeia piscesae TaxID=27915 RepID=A0AAD9UEW3_RIDPI|nr:hypothetical protein NP493_189g01009 [Ridgeia piscesae]